LALSFSGPAAITHLAANPNKAEKQEKYF